MQDFIDRIHERNRINHELIQKRRTLLKLEYIPEAVDECQQLENEIHELENQLAMT